MERRPVALRAGGKDSAGDSTREVKTRLWDDDGDIGHDDGVKPGKPDRDEPDHDTGGGGDVYLEVRGPALSRP